MSIVELTGNEPPKEASRLSLAQREGLWGYLFISPWIIGFLLLTLVPVAATLVFTFLNLRLNQQTPVRFVGLENYATLLEDPRAWEALGVTLRFALIALPVGLVLPFALAMLMNSKVSTICDNMLAIAARSQSSRPPGRVSARKMVTVWDCDVP